MQGTKKHKYENNSTGTRIAHFELTSQEIGQVGPHAGRSAKLGDQAPYLLK